MTSKKSKREGGSLTPPSLQPFTPIFSAEDELILLEEYNKFVDKNGEEVKNKWVKFLEKSKLKGRYDRRQISKKMGGLQNRYEKKNYSNSPSFLSLNQDEQQRYLRLSQSLWGGKKGGGMEETDLPLAVGGMEETDLPLAVVASSSLHKNKNKNKNEWNALQLEELHLYCQKLAIDQKACQLRLQRLRDSSSSSSSSSPSSSSSSTVSLSEEEEEEEDEEDCVARDYDLDDKEFEQENYMSTKSEVGQLAIVSVEERSENTQSCDGIEKAVIDGNTCKEVEAVQIEEPRSTKKKGRKRKVTEVKTLESGVIIEEEVVVGDPNRRTLESGVIIEEVVAGDPNKRTLESGVIIEEVVAGNPNKRAASKGSMVRVHVTGKLKDSGHIFESTDGKPPLPICLGSKDMIDGFSEGVEGMRIGGKRRIIIPPSMGFGDSGNGKLVPPNSWLEYEVELTGVRKY